MSLPDLRKPSERSYQNRVRSLLIFTGGLILAGLFFFVFHRPLSGPGDHSAKTSNPSRQYLVGQGHILGFSKGGMYLAARDHLLKVEFVGAEAKEPAAMEADEAHAPTPVPAGFKNSPVLPPFRGVVFRDAWPGVTIRYDPGPGSIVKSSYFIAAGLKGNPVEKIRLRYNRPLRLTAQGNLAVRFDQGEMVESVPVAWKSKGGLKQKVNCRYCQITEKEIGFVAEYDPACEMVIDPFYVWNPNPGKLLSLNQVLTFF